MADAHEYRRRITDIEAFMAALNAFLAVCDREPDDFYAVSNPRWWPKPGRELEATQLAAQVDRVAGRAAQAFGNQFWIDYKPRGTMQTRPMSPAMNWRSLLNDDPELTADIIFSVSNQAIGTLELWAEQAAEKPKGEPRTKRERREVHIGGALLASLIGIPAALVVTLVGAYLAHHFGWV